MSLAGFCTTTSKPSGCKAWGHVCFDKGIASLKRGYNVEAVSSDEHTLVAKLVTQLDISDIVIASYLNPYSAGYRCIHVWPSVSDTSLELKYYNFEGLECELGEFTGELSFTVFSDSV